MSERWTAMYSLFAEDVDSSQGVAVFWKVLPGLAVAMLVICALALIASFLIVTSASAEVGSDALRTSRHEAMAAPSTAPQRPDKSPWGR